MMSPRGSLASTRTGYVCAAALAFAAATVGCHPEPHGDVVVFASGADLESANPLVTIHPLARQVQRYALFVTLARLDSSLAARPYAATSWQWSDDRRSLTLRLMPGLRWQDGAPTNAGDVAFTLEAARDPATGFSRAAELSDLERIEAPDDSTIVLRFVRAPPAFPEILCELPIVPRHLLASVPRAAMRSAEFNQSPIGNGPFLFRSRVRGQRWLLERNADFPKALGGPPRIAELIIAVVDEASTKFAGLVAGDLDVAGISPSMAELTERDPTLRVLSYPTLMSFAIVFAAHRPPFDDWRVRRAIELSLDRQRIVDGALAGFGVASASPLPPDHPFGSGALALRDTARADSLLDAAGWRRGADRLRHRDGRALEFELLTVGGADNAVEQLIQSDLARRGIRMFIRVRELGSFLTTARAPEKRFDALFTGIPGDLSLSYLSAMFDTRQAGGALDYSSYHEPFLDSLLGAARSALTPTQARTAWAQVQSAIVDSAPAVWVYHARGVQGVSRRVSDISMDLRGELVSVSRWHVAPAAEAR
jgi:peptide/nickel transport system substrate-binding protein